MWKFTNLFFLYLENFVFNKFILLLADADKAEKINVDANNVFQIFKYLF